MKCSNIIQQNYTVKRLRLPLETDILIDVSDPIYTFDEVLGSVDLKKYLISELKDPRGRIGYNPINLLKVILFGFMMNGYVSLRELEDLCKTNIRYMWLLRDEDDYPSHQTFGNFMNLYLKDNIENIFRDINNYIFTKDNVDLRNLYIDGTKLEASSNKYTWVWKKACLTSRERLYKKITLTLDSINNELLTLESFRYGLREIYEIDYLEDLFNDYLNRFKVDISSFVYKQGKRKTAIQRYYDNLFEYLNKLKEYATKIEICGTNRNSYSKTDKDATFMRIKTDYMGNDQLLPAYNYQIGVSDEYIAVCDVNQYASDQDCFVPLMNKYKELYNKYPERAIGDAGYGSYNNYLFCDTNNIGKYMKFTMYKKETTNEKYREDIFRAVNFKRDIDDDLVCPNNKKFKFSHTKPVKGNKFERTEEYYKCEDCTGCPLRELCHKQAGNRIVKVNEELTSFHEEVILNLESTRGALLRMNRSIQAEGVFGTIKHNRFYKRIVRKNLDSVKLEIFMVSIGFNLMKYHNKKQRLIC